MAASRKMHPHPHKLQQHISLACVCHSLIPSYCGIFSAIGLCSSDPRVCCRRLETWRDSALSCGSGWGCGSHCHRRQQKNDNLDSKTNGELRTAGHFTYTTRALEETKIKKENRKQAALNNRWRIRQLTRMQEVAHTKMKNLMQGNMRQMCQEA